MVSPLWVDHNEEGIGRGWTVMGGTVQVDLYESSTSSIYLLNTD